MALRTWRAVVFAGVLCWPLYWLFLALTQSAGPDPGKFLVDNLGQGALILLLLTLCMTPLRRLSGWGGWLAVRRQLGLWCFSYAMLHLSGYLLFILGWRLDRLLDDLSERPYIVVGALALLLLLPLALTSNRFSQSWLGRRWRQLHRLVYLVLLLALLHMLWVVRSDLAEWALYAGIGLCLLLLRLPIAIAAIARIKTLMDRLFMKGVDG